MNSSAATQDLFMLLWTAYVIVSSANGNQKKKCAKLQLECYKQTMTFGESLN